MCVMPPARDGRVKTVMANNIKDKHADVSKANITNPKICAPKLPKSMFPFVNFNFSHYEIWVLGWGSRRVQGGRG